MEKIFRRIPTDYSTNEREQVMLLFQEMMGKFLDIQKKVMLDFLGNVTSHTVPETIPQQAERGAGEEISPSSPADPPLIILRQKLPDECQSRQDEREISPSGKREETIPDKIEKSNTVPGKAEKEETVSGKAEKEEISFDKEEKPDRERFQEILLGIVSERTGYPQDMLDLDLDMEADLGIDSIKRVEILGSLQKEISGLYQEQDLNKGEGVEKLSEVKTLRGIIDGMM